jgi:guanine deaminase
MQLADTIGSFAAGSEADFIALDPKGTPLLARRTGQAQSLEELLFALAILGDERAIAATWSGGKLLQSRDREAPPTATIS